MTHPQGYEEQKITQEIWNWPGYLPFKCFSGPHTATLGSCLWTHTFGYLSHILKRWWGTTGSTLSLGDQQPTLAKTSAMVRNTLCGYAKEVSSRNTNCLLWESILEFGPQVALEYINFRNNEKSRNLYPSTGDVFKVTLSFQLNKWLVGQQPCKTLTILRKGVGKFFSKYSLEKLLWWKRNEACMINGPMRLSHQNSKQKSQTRHIFPHPWAFANAVLSAWNVPPHPPILSPPTLIIPSKS